MCNNFLKMLGIRIIAMSLAMSMATSSIPVLASANTTPARLPRATQSTALDDKSVRVQMPMAAPSNAGVRTKTPVLGLGNSGGNGVMPMPTELKLDLKGSLKGIQPGDRLLINPDGMVTIDEQHRAEARSGATRDSGDAKARYLDSSSRANPEYEGILNEAELANRRIYLETKPPQGDELDQVMRAADTWSAEVSARVLDSSGGADYMASLNQNTPNDKFSVVPMPAPTSGFSLLSAVTNTRVLSSVVDNLTSAVRDSGSVGGESGRDDKEEADKEKTDKEEIDEEDRKENDLEEQEDRYRSDVRDSSGMDPGTDVFIVDEDVLILQVKDQNNNPVNGAAVYAKIGTRELRSVTQRMNNVDGCVMFTGMTGLNSGYLDISKDGFRVITQLDTDLHGGAKLDRQLVPVRKDEIYPRVMDIGGSDMMNTSPELFLTQYAVSKYDIVFVLSGGSPAAFNNNNPGPVKLEAKDQNGNTRTIMSASPQDIGSKMHWKYTFNNRWAELKSGEEKLFEAGNTASFVYGSDRYNAKLVVKNAAFEKPWYLPDMEFGFNGGYGRVKLPDWVPVVGGSPIEMEIVKFPALLIVNPSGTGMIGINVRADKMVQESTYKANYDCPRFINKVDGVINNIKEYAKSRINQVMAAKKFVGNFKPPLDNYIIKTVQKSIQVIMYAQCKYNWDTGYVHTGITAVVAVDAAGTLTTHMLIPPPVYIGATINVGAMLTGGLGVRFKPGERFKETLEIDKTTKITGFAIGASLGATLFAGVGLRGIMCLEAGGGATLNALADFRLQEDRRPPGKSYPRFTLDLTFNYYIKAFLAFFSVGVSGSKTVPRLYDTWGLGDDVANVGIEEPQTEVYEVVFDGMAEGEGSSYDPETGIITPGTLYGSPSFDYGPVGGETDGKNGYVSTAMSNVGVGANSPIRYVNTDAGVYAFRLAVVKDYYWGAPYEHPALIYQKQNPDGKTFENKYYQVPVPFESKYSNYDYVYEFDVATHPSRVVVNIAMVNGYKGTFYGMEDCMLNTVARRVSLILGNNKVIMDKVVPIPTAYPQPGKGYIHSPVVSMLNDDNAVFAWVGTTNPLSVKPNTRKNYLITYYGYDQNGIADLGYDKAIPSRIFAGPILPLLNGSGQPSEKDGDVYIANSWYEDQEYEITTFNSKMPTNGLNKTSLKIKNPSSVRLYKDDPLAGGQNFMMYVDNGQLNLFAGDKSKLATDKIVTVGGKPFTLPPNSDVYAYASGKVGGNSVMKLVTIHKETPDLDGSNRIDSVINVYNMQRVSADKIVARGPRQYRLEGVDIIHAEVMFDDWSASKGLKMLYTANNQTTKVKEYNYDGQGATGEIKSICNVYRWDEPNFPSVIATTFTMDNPVISKKDKTLKGYIEIFNDGVVPATSVTIEVTDNNGRVITTHERAVDIFPGEKLAFDWTFDQPSNWQVGPMHLTARVKSAKAIGLDGTAQTVPVADDGVYSITQQYENCYLELDGNDEIYNDRHYAALTVRNRSMMPTGDNSELRIYRIKTSGEIDETFYTTYNLGVLEEGNSRDGEFKDHSYNMMIPLEEYWNDEDCRGVFINIACASDDHVQTSMELFNPNAALRYPVNVDANDAVYGTVEGGGYLLPGRSTTLKAEPKPGYRFAGWMDETGRIVSTDPNYSMEVPSQTVNLIAKFEETGEVHKVALEIGTVALTMADGSVQQIKGGIPILSGGNLNTTFAESYTVDHGATIELSANPVGDYAFVHWEDENGNVLSTREEYSMPVTQQMGIKAVYAQGVRRFNLALEAGVGGECETGSMWTNTKGEIDTPLPSATKSGSSFLGWFTQETDGTRVTESHVFTNDTILYAQYSGSSGGGGGGSGGGSSGGNKLLPPKKDKETVSSSSAPSKTEAPVSSSMPAPAAPAQSQPQPSGTSSAASAAESSSASQTEPLLSSSDTSEPIESSSSELQQPDSADSEQPRDQSSKNGVPVVPIAVGVVALLVLIGGGAAAVAAASGGTAAAGFGGKLLALLKRLFKR